MEIRFYCMHKGEKMYRVLDMGEEIFCGTKGECHRFIEIHNEKVARGEPCKKDKRPAPLTEKVRRIRRR